MTPFRQKRTLVQKAVEHLLDPRDKVYDSELCLFLDDAILKANSELKVPMSEDVPTSLIKELRTALVEFTGSVVTSGTVGNVLRTTPLSDEDIERYELAYHTRLGLVKTYTEKGFNVLGSIEYGIANLSADSYVKRRLGHDLHQED